MQPTVTRAVDDPTCHGCIIARAHRADIERLRARVAHLEAERADLLAEIARRSGLTRLPGAVEAAHPGSPP